MSFFLQIKRSPVKVKKKRFKQMTLALPIETDRQNLLAGLRHSSLVRDDSGKHRVYRDEEEREYHSVTSILKHTAPVEQKAALMKWAKRPGNLEQRDMACSIGTAVHSYCEKILKRASIMAINSANKRNGWKTYEDGLARPSQAITTWALQNAIHGKNKVEEQWACSEYTRNIQPFLEDIKAIHLSEFNINHSSGYAGQCDALIDTENPDGHSELTIVDFKTYGKDTDKPEKYLQDHLLQIGAYNEGLYEKTGVRAKRGLVCIIRKNGLQLRWVTAMELIGCGALFKEKVAEFQDMVKKDLLVAV